MASGAEEGRDVMEKAGRLGVKQNIHRPAEISEWGNPHGNTASLHGKYIAMWRKPELKTSK